MIATRFMELRKRRGLMIALILVTIGIPTVFLVIRLLLHAFAPKTYGPAGGYDIYTALVSGVLYVFGFIVAATLGATAGSADLGEGMFRHLVVTGRSRLALYLARIPAGLAIIVPLVAVGFTIVCTVCVFAAPTTARLPRRDRARRLVACRPRELGRRPRRRGGLQLQHQDRTVHAGRSHDQPGAQRRPVRQRARRRSGDRQAGPRAPRASRQPSQAQIAHVAVLMADQNYADYARQFLYPSTSLMIKSGLWLELEAVIGFVVGLGLGSLIGQRTVAVVLMIVLEVILTPILSRAHIPHLINLQRAVVGLAMAHSDPGRAPRARRRRGGRESGLLPESTTVAVCVIVAWLVGWTVLGAWRMITRDA